MDTYKSILCVWLCLCVYAHLYARVCVHGWEWVLGWGLITYHSMCVGSALTLHTRTIDPPRGRYHPMCEPDPTPVTKTVDDAIVSI
jgi:hypothetical protein